MFDSLIFDALIFDMESSVARLIRSRRRRHGLDYGLWIEGNK